MKKYLNRIAGFQSRLVRFENEPVTKLALCFILLLDFFILSILFSGLEDHTSQLTSPDEYFPAEARGVFIQNEWNDANRMDKLQQLVLTDYQNYSYRFEHIIDEHRIQKMHPVARQFFQDIQSIAKDSSLKSLFVQRQALLSRRSQIGQQFQDQKDLYQATLLERIAENAPLQETGISDEIQKKTDAMAELNHRLSEIDKELNQNVRIDHLWQLVEKDDASMRERLVLKINRFERIYSFREFAWQLLFLLPLFVAALVWYNHSLRKTYKVQTLFSAHFVIITAIPIVVKLIDWIHDLIPFDLFRELFEFFKQIHIIALWHYLVIFISILVALLMVYFVQKKVFSRQRLIEKRLSRGQCIACGKKQPRQSPRCPFCGAEQLHVCSACQNETPVGSVFCIHCGGIQNH